MNAQVIVGIKDAEGKLIAEQPYEDYVNGNRDTEISLYSHGTQLFNILYDEFGYIKLENNILVFNHIFVHNTYETAMRLLGRIAEATIVRRCNENVEINRKWVKFARIGENISKTADNYIAIGTGLLSTKKLYASKYNPGDTQRDIKWVNKDDLQSELMMIKKGNIDGMVAGIQSKVSILGTPYIFNDLVIQRYEVPVVYFGIYNDYHEIAYNLFLKRKDVDIGKYFVDARVIDFDAFEEVKSYVPLIIGLIEKKITPDQLLKSNLNNTLKSAIIGTGTDPFIPGGIVIP